MARQTKADRILSDAAMRLEAARIRERTAQSELHTAKATLAVLQDAYDALEKELTPKPRKKSAPAAAPAQKDLPTEPTTKEPLCGACGNVADYQDHSQPSPHYHPFVSNAPVATKRSSRKKEGTNSIPNTGTDQESVLVAEQRGD